MSSKAVTAVVRAAGSIQSREDDLATAGAGATLYRDAASWLDQRDLERAERGFRRAIAAKVNVAESHNALGVIHGKRGELRIAEAHFREAIALNAATGTACFNLGLLLDGEGQREAALCALREAAMREPRHEGFLSKFVELCRLAARDAEAFEVLESLVANDPGNEGAWAWFGALHLGRKAFADAARCYAEAYRLKGEKLVTINNYAWALLNDGHAAQALAILLPGVDLYPSESALWRNLGQAYQTLGHLELAEMCLEKAVQVAPSAWENHYKLGHFKFQVRNAVERSREHFMAALACNPGAADAHNMLGNTYVRLGNAAVALAIFDRSIALNARDPLYLINRAIALRHLKRYAEAEQSFEQALRLDPNHADAHLGLGMVKLLQGDFASGWSEYEWRVRLAGFVGIRDCGVPRWRGEPLRGKRLFACAEQGFGDTIQFVRYLEILQRRFEPEEIVFCCDPGLEALFKQTPGFSRLVFERTPPPGMDFHINLLSIPTVLGTRVETIPGETNYLAVDRQRKSGWQQRLAESGSPKIGIVWQGRATHVNDHNRSCPLAEWAPVLERRPDVHFVSLQLGPAAAALKTLEIGRRVEDLSKNLGDFADTAAVIAGLDLVIGVDTAVVHLAGALNTPVWTLLPYDPDWRWLLDRDDSPWYASMRLFRQERFGDWRGVMARVAHALDECLPAGARRAAGDP